MLCISFILPSNSVSLTAFSCPLSSLLPPAPLPPPMIAWLAPQRENVLSELDSFQAGSIWQSLGCMFLGSPSCSHLIRMTVSTCKSSSLCGFTSWGPREQPQTSRWDQGQHLSLQMWPLPLFPTVTELQEGKGNMDPEWEEYRWKMQSLATMAFQGSPDVPDNII